jgi:hypothetical protein
MMPVPDCLSYNITYMKIHVTVQMWSWFGHLANQREQWTGWHSSNALDLYLGGARLESRPGQQLPWLMFSTVLISPSTKILG